MKNGGIERGIVRGVGGQKSPQERERRGTHGMVIKQIVDHVIFGWNGSFRKEESKKNVAHPKISRVIRKNLIFFFFNFLFFSLDYFFLNHSLYVTLQIYFSLFAFIFFSFARDAQ